MESFPENDSIELHIMWHVCGMNQHLIFVKSVYIYRCVHANVPATDLNSENGFWRKSIYCDDNVVISSGENY